ncbi:MAG: hypothetical protein GY708_12300 [Actinomycetia bacterium]|nr:hypothetical protein [Actinomycetes bacterium]
MWSLACLVAVGLAGLLSFIATSSLVSSTRRIERNSGPVLVATQDVLASVAEADAASTSVFLAGQNEDRAQRLLYEESLSRSVSQVEEVARLIGDDEEAHTALKSVASELVVYSGQVESARSASIAGSADADGLLTVSLATVRDRIFPEIDQIAVRADAQVDDDTRGLTSTVVAVAAALVSALVLLAANRSVRRRTNRLVNLGLVGGAVLFVGLAVWVAAASSARSVELDRARSGGFEAIASTARIQQAGFSYKTAEAVSIVEGRSDPELANHASIVETLLSEAAGLADSDREDAAVVELSIRWQRYLATSQQVATLLDSDSVVEARSYAAADGNSAFNGFNTAVESVLSDNRSQFADGVDSARGALSYLRVASIVFAVIAALGAWFGLQTRIDEYQ